MIEIHTSNRLSILCDHLARILRDTPLPPLEREWIVVQSQGMQRWLTLEFAQRLGIAANLHTPFPVTFCEQLTAERTAGGLDRDALTWQLFSLLEAPDSELRPYLDDDTDQRKRYQLASRIANRFEDYQLYRPDLVQSWADLADSNANDTPHAGWQAQLWRACGLADLARQPEDLEAAIAALHPSQLPSRVSVFGVSTLPPAILDLLQLLARRIPVRIYFVSPTYHFWGDLRSEREHARLQRRLRGPRPSEHIEHGNALLTSLGHQGRDFFNLLQKRDPDGSAWQELEFEDIEPTTTLRAIQHDILHLVDRGTATEDPLPIGAGDDSLQVHVCHSPMREMEVIRDQLLARFAADPSLRPHDVLVLVPDMAEYGPYVQAVFGKTHHGTPRIPFHIADRDLGQEHPIATAFLQVLEAAHDRLEVTTVLDLLEVAALRRTFDLEAVDLPTLRSWTSVANIRWGLDGTDRETWHGVPAFEANTWRQGLDRLLLGFAMGPTNQLIDGTAPCGEDTTGRSDTLGSFADFAETLFSLLGDLRRTQSASSWAKVLVHTVDSLFTASDEVEESGIQFVRDQCSQLSQSPLTEDDAIHPAVIREHLGQILQSDSQGSTFLTGNVTVCALKPMRTIPFQIVAVAGLHDGSFPRSVTPLAFDLIAKNPRPGDRSVRDDDRYLFLELLVATGQSLILTYVGRSQKDATELPPSPVLAELLDTVERSFTTGTETSAAELITTVHPLTAFSPAYFESRDGKLFSYSKDDLEACLAGVSACSAAPAFVPEPLPALPDNPLRLDLDELIRFWMNPSRGFCERRLELRIPRLEDEQPASEPFALDALERYHLQDWLLERRTQDLGSRADDFELARSRGQLPVGALGRALHRDTVAAIDPLWNQIESYRATETASIDFSGEDWNITGSIDNICSVGRLQYRTAKISAKDLLSAWIRHLALHIACEAHAEPALHMTILFAPDVKPQHLRPTTDARRHFQVLIDGYRAGMTTPLPFFVKTSHEFARRLLNPKKPIPPDAAVRAARAKYDAARNDDAPPTESQDPYIAACFRHGDPLTADIHDAEKPDDPVTQRAGTTGQTFKHWAEAVWAPVLQHLEKGAP